MICTFTSYEVQDAGMTLHFVSQDPGAGKPSDYYILLTDADLATVTKLAEFQMLVQTRLKRKVNAVGIATKLDPLIGQSVVV